MRDEALVCPSTDSGVYCLPICLKILPLTFLILPK